MTHCRRCGFHVGINASGAATTACEYWPRPPDLDGPDPGCDWP